jgi:hypothetical protein
MEGAARMRPRYRCLDAKGRVGLIIAHEWSFRLSLSQNGNHRAALETKKTAPRVPSSQNAC